MQWPVAVAFGKRDGALRDAVNGVLNRISAKVDDLKVKYGFPAGEPVTLAEGPTPVKEAMKAPEVEPSTAKSAPGPANPAVKVAEASESAQTGGAPADSAALTPPQGAASDSDRVREGKEVFNGTCSHCHGPDAVQAERKIDLRLLHHRYKDRMEEIFFKTVTDGRPTKGMPAWKDVFSQEQFVSILAFLKTVQTD
jgi:mono/diheme cytochrome c family protein